ncbi:hypothetical protein ACQPZP_04385 [Spirillospora sp. CA-142024]|uniref:hypothetical protein n=1 Tax=Spirillospora sp. CA-142024 TaxID=3240036 RepID=UPI003D8DAC6B
MLDELADVILTAAVPMLDLAGGPDHANRHLARRLGIVSARDTAAAHTDTNGWYGSFIAPHLLLQRDDGKVLVLRRHNTGYRDGWLCPPAGRIEPGPCHAVSDYWFAFHHWTGEPHAAEPDKASEALWIDPTAPPADLIPHCAQALAAIGRGEPFGVHGWTPNS